MHAYSPAGELLCSARRPAQGTLKMASLRSLCYNFSMLSIFPNLFTYSLLAPFLLRVVIGIIFIDLGYFKFGKEKPAWNMFFETIHFKPNYLFVILLAIIEIVSGAFLILGYLTQMAALIMAVILFAEAYVELRDGSILKRDIVFYTLLLVICVSLLLTGAGAFALDLPL